MTIITITIRQDQQPLLKALSVPERDPFVIFHCGLWGSRRWLGDSRLPDDDIQPAKRERPKPSGLNYLLTQIIKFQGPHGSGATKPKGRLGLGIALAGGSSSLNQARSSSATHTTSGWVSEEAGFPPPPTGSWEVFNGLLEARPPTMFILILACWIATHLGLSWKSVQQPRNIWSLTLDNI